MIALNIQDEQAHLSEQTSRLFKSLILVSKMAAKEITHENKSSRFNDKTSAHKFYGKLKTDKDYDPLQERSPIDSQPIEDIDKIALETASYHRTIIELQGLSQFIKSKEDLYTPIYVRGKGKTKEGLCRLCKRPSWFNIKISQYWYHLNIIHGISSSTG
eukprot:NODE_207_length_12890_cov_0.936518.p8 type:complete len:159 gc:universal NODE_207_length_12890_cov_0.936518:9587-9111(-)